MLSRGIVDKKSPAGCDVSRVLFPRAAGRRREGEGHLSGPAIAGRLIPARFPGHRVAAYPRSKGVNHATDRCLALRPVGFTMPADSRPPRCALTAPFHPYPPRSLLTGAPEAGGIFSVALSLSAIRRQRPCKHGSASGTRTVGVTHHRGSTALGLSSPRGITPQRAAFFASGRESLYSIPAYAGHANRREHR